MIETISAIVISILPFLYLFTQIKILGNFTYAFANIAGFIGAILLFWEFILGIKPFAKRISANPAVFIKLHIFLGVWGMFFVLIHPILEMFSYAEKLTFLYVPDLSSSFATHITLGRFAILLVLLVWITSTFLRQNISYKKWINIHYLSYPMMFFVFIHALDIGSYLNTFVFIKIYWIILLCLYLILVVWRIIDAIKNSIKK
ncbi:MAG: ferric reductase-like transmembrane domain-containing protein [Candidatus Roizmanbacteria bacterium]|nr:ferric reductase-like transmembrane domain-containing protein [Candidatus Roizmanbacteria bacterium]